MPDSRGNNYGKFYSFQSKPVLLDLNFVVDSTNGNGLGIRSLKGEGVEQVYMHTSATPLAGNPNPASGYALVKLAFNYTRVYGSFRNLTGPVTGSNLAINGSALTPGIPYVITSVGAGPAGTTTIAPVADTAGSLASTWFRLYDSYGNTFIIWFSVSGVGSAPTGVSGTLVQQTISSGATAAQVGTALAITINGLPSGVAGVASFTATGTTTVTVTSTKTQPLAGPAAEGAIPTGFTFALGNYSTNLQDWQGVGLPKGVVPAVGAAFVATAAGYTTGGGSTGLVKATTISGITATEGLGDSNLSLSPIPMGGSPNVGGLFLVKFLGATSSSVTTLIPTAPADGTVVSMTLLLESASRVGGNQE